MFEETAENVTANSLKGIKSAVDSTLRPYSVLVNHNLGNVGVTATLPMYQFYSMSAVANEAGLAEAGIDGPIAQRKLDPKHALKLAVFMARGLLDALYKKLTEEGGPIPEELDRIRSEMGKQPYFALQPIVVNIRTCGTNGSGLKFEQIGPGYVKMYLSDRDTLWVVDGQHRRHAMDLLFDFLDFVLKNHTYPKRGPVVYRREDDSELLPSESAIWRRVFELARSECTVLLDIHLGLDAEKERQLFHDLNNLVKKVEASLAFQFDDSNPVNLFIKEQLIGNGILGCRVVDKDVTNWHDDEGVIGRKELIAINARLLLNKTTVSGAKPQDLSEKMDVAKEFWEAISGIPNFGEAGAKRTTVAAQPVVLKALAKLTYDFAFGREKDPDLLDRLLQGLDEIDFSHENPMWRYFELSDEQRVKYGLTGLADYLPDDNKGANRDVGGWIDKDNVMRFGAKHNDIFPILGDMIRWKLCLPNRQRRSAANKDELSVSSM